MKNYLTSLLFLILLLVSACSADKETRLIVLSTTDTHGHVFAWDFYADNEDERHSLLKAASVIDSVRSEQQHTILLDGGDWIQGNPFAEFYARQDSTAKYPMLEAAQAMRYDAIVIGNHEFNFGIDLLNKRVQETDIPFLAGNITKPESDEPAYTPYIYKDINGYKVAIIGLTTPGSAIWDRPRVEDRLAFRDGVEFAKTNVDKVTEEGADVVIILAHAGVGPGSSYTSDTVAEENFGRRIIEEVPGVHLLVLGHSHRTIEGEVITSEANPQGVPIIMAGRWASHVGYTELVITSIDNGVEVSIENSQLIAVEPYKMKPDLVELLSEPFERVRGHINEPVAQTQSEWSAQNGRMYDLAITDLIQHVQHQVTGADISLASVFNPETEFGPGSVSRGDLARLYPYENTLFKKRITGQTLKDILEFSARYYETTEAGKTPQPSGVTPGYNFDVASGVTYELDLTQPVGERVKNLRFKNRAVRDNQSFTIAVNSYRAVGGGDYDMLANAETLEVYDTSVRSLIETYLREKGTIEPNDVHRQNWKILHLPK